MLPLAGRQSTVGFAREFRDHRDIRGITDQLMLCM